MRCLGSLPHTFACRIGASQLCRTTLRLITRHGVLSAVWRAAVAATHSKAGRAGNLLKIEHVEMSFSILYDTLTGCLLAVKTSYDMRTRYKVSCHSVTCQLGFLTHSRGRGSIEREQRLAGYQSGTAQKSMPRRLVQILTPFNTIHTRFTQAGYSSGIFPHRCGARMCTCVRTHIHACKQRTCTPRVPSASQSLRRLRSQQPHACLSPTQHTFTCIKEQNDRD
jgi:hypothetical protein